MARMKHACPGVLKGPTADCVRMVQPVSQPEHTAECVKHECGLQRDIAAFERFTAEDAAGRQMVAVWSHAFSPLSESSMDTSLHV